jgi:transposase-like protein
MIVVVVVYAAVKILGLAQIREFEIWLTLIMAMKNKYIYAAHISEAKFRQLLRCFAEDLPASQAAVLCRLNRKTVDRVYGLLRVRIAGICAGQSPFSGEVEADESYFGARRVPGKRGRGAAGKTPVFGLLKRNGKVYTEIVPDCSKATLQKIIRGRVAPDSVIHSDQWRGYDGLVDLGYGHFRVHHGQNEFANAKSHINGIESFWSYAKRRLTKFNGVAKNSFHWYLKETEFRFNHRNQNLYQVLLKECRENPL